MQGACKNSSAKGSNNASMIDEINKLLLPQV